MLTIFNKERCKYLNVKFLFVWLYYYVNVITQYFLETIVIYQMKGDCAFHSESTDITAFYYSVRSPIECESFFFLYFYKLSFVSDQILAKCFAFVFDKETMVECFNQAVLECAISYKMTAWFGNLPVSSKYKFLFIIIIISLTSGRKDNPLWSIHVQTRFTQGPPTSRGPPRVHYLYLLYLCF